ncbi:tRNase Z TRZ3, mitochondrial isoform X3 [Brachypodium distachyon]|uniref:tRNase Z TRZ3, mitochondrial isoform X3 n=1 Tax=Brachypodium distachyon TaxID=15368 RepID=UPI00071C4019|nr:tRNase Z TRZ3, mitochondrial isoform X3 [Brachypodium distachyon]|eukprot:XP_014754632.1 tRNase Z TRZ3, mitochondrial isoform X3 [Brachypodium distachyon]
MVQFKCLGFRVHPSDVLGPSIPGPIVLLVDCPTQYHMCELLSLQSLSRFYEDSCQTENAKKVNCIIHLGPSSVTNTVDYQNWMEVFGTTQHIMAGHDNKNMEIPILKGSSRISSCLNFVCPQLFPSFGFWPVEPATDVDLEENKSTSSQTCESVTAAKLKIAWIVNLVVAKSERTTTTLDKVTFEDSMKDEAIARNHSTTKEAIAVGTSAGAYRIISTHFSQRYPKIPVFDEDDMRKTCIAFDLMSVNLADLPVLPKVLPHLKLLYRDEMVVEELDEVQEAVV